MVPHPGQPLDHRGDPVQGGDTELAGDLSLADADGEQLGRAQPAGLEPVAFLSCRRAAGNGWHGRILPGGRRSANSSTQHPRPLKMGASLDGEEARMDQAQARALLDQERARLERLLAAAPGEPGEADLGDEVDDADRREAGQTGVAVGQLLRARWAALERAEARLAAGGYGRSVRSGRPIPDERLEADPLAELTVEEAAAAARGTVEEDDGAVGLASATHPFEVLDDADITPEEEAADQDGDEPAPEQSAGIRVERDDRIR
jgi:DnaK suppressor protein